MSTNVINFRQLQHIFVLINKWLVKMHYKSNDILCKMSLCVELYCRIIENPLILCYNYRVISDYGRKSGYNIFFDWKSYKWQKIS